MKEKKPINVEIGGRIQYYREAAGLTQEVFSEMIGLGVKHVSAIERGAVGVSLSTLKRVSAVLSISADVLLFGEDDKAGQQKRTNDIQLLMSRLSRLPPNKFNVVKEIMDRLLEVLVTD